MLPKDLCEIDLLKMRNQTIFFLRAACKSDEIKVFSKFRLTKEVIALIVILTDAGICIVLFLLFQYLKAMQELCNAEVNGSVLAAQDFSIQDWSLPPH